MNYFDLYSTYPDRTITAAWDSQVKEVNNTPWLAGTLTDCGDELFARFAACYAELRALPRSARRALQRRCEGCVRGEAGTVSYSASGATLQLFPGDFMGTFFTNVGEQDIWIMIGAWIIKEDLH
jgi:hypothetical protein